MKVTSLHIRDFKRFRTPGIKEFYAQFHAPVQIITGVNGSAKSSVLRELCPLPPTRSMYEQNGYKEIHYIHNGHEYILKSNFSNRNSPHSFVIDAKEYNISGTTDIQEELVAKHFGITPSIRNLIYNKVMLCSTTKAERKNLFLSINPMQLGLILDAHKKALSRVKDCKANLNHLYARRADIEAKLLKPDILEQHAKTKQTLTEQVAEVDALLLKLDQHIANLKNLYQDDLEYYHSRVDQKIPLFPMKQITEECKQILRRAWKYTLVDRNDYQKQFNTFKEQKNQKSFEKSVLVTSIMEVSQEINEYTSHFENATERPVSKIENEIQELDKELARYTNLPESPATLESLPSKERLLASVQQKLFVFRDMTTKLIPVVEYESLCKEYRELQSTLNLSSQQLASLTSLKDNYTKELDQQTKEAGIPQSCTLRQCGLRSLFDKRAQQIQDTLKRTTDELAKVQKEHQKHETRYKELHEKVKGYLDTDIYSQYTDLLSILQQYYPIETWSDTLMDKLNTQPLLIGNQLTEYIEQSKMYYEYKKLENKKQLLTKELETVMKTTGASLEFLQNKVKEKELALKKYMNEVVALDKELQVLDEGYLTCLGYTTDIEKLQQFDTLISRGTRALIIENSVKYWTRLKEYLTKGKWILGEELRKIETIVRDQMMLKNTYETEIITQIKKYTQMKSLYEKVEMALSPTTGLPHKSMVRYLNALINNVNYFISQIWSYKLKLLPLPEDQPIDYTFKIEVANAISGDISELSDGQTEIVNLAWVLAILLQMKLLDKIPFFADEVGRALDANHRNALLKFLGQLIENKLIEQLFIVNHYAVFTDGFREADIVCMSRSSLGDLPGNTNEHVKIV